jgi:hypothetical protein
MRVALPALHIAASFSLTDQTNLRLPSRKNSPNCEGSLLFSAKRQRVGLIAT